MITRVELYSPLPSAPELPLGGFMPNDDPIQILDIQGLGPVKAELQSTPFATGRGELYQGSSTGKRNITLNLGFNPNWANQTISSLRQMLYAYLLPEAWVKLRFFSDEMPTVDIEGYVESLEPNIFSQDPQLQASIICPKPDFTEIDATILRGIVDDGTHEEVFDYIGTVPVGFELRIDGTGANASYTGPVSVSLTFIETEIFEVDSVTIDTTRYLKLSTRSQNKRISSIELADGSVTNLLSKVTDESLWPILRPGPNVLKVIANEPNQAWTFAYFNRFGGL